MPRYNCFDCINEFLNIHVYIHDMICEHILLYDLTWRKYCTKTKMTSYKHRSCLYSMFYTQKNILHKNYLEYD